jgi:hypothetical protein
LQQPVFFICKQMPDLSGEYSRLNKYHLLAYSPRSYKDTTYYTPLADIAQVTED